MKINMTKREQQVLGVVVVLGLCITWGYMTYFSVIRGAADRLGGEVRSARDRVQVIEKALASESQIRQQYAQMDQSVNSLRTQLPPEEQLSSVIEHLSDLASQSQVKIQTIFPQRQTDEEAAGSSLLGQKPPIYTVTPIQIDAVAGYHELGTFLNLVEMSHSPMELASLRISANPNQIKRHTIKIVLDVFFATSAGPKSSSASAAPARSGS